MRLVIITKSYNSAEINQKVQPTPLNAEGTPKYAIYLSDERAQALIDAGVAVEYVTEDLITVVSNGTVANNSNLNDSDVDDNINSNANDEDPNVEDSNEDKSEEQLIDNKSKSNSKKNK